jgi:zinc D-Ala-D-Ala dipeptidase
VIYFNKYNFVLIALFTWASCKQDIAEQGKSISNSRIIKLFNKKLPDSYNIIYPKDTTEMERLLINYGLVNVQSIDSTIICDLRYATENNFLKKNMYGDFKKCYLQADVAEKLAEAQKYLKEENPSYSLIVFDAVRPRSIQQKMWDALDMEISQKSKYVSNPRYGSLHNFGAAVDLSIADSSGKELDMGTPFDYFGELAYPVKEKELLEKKILTEIQVKNRELLRRVMYKAGFFNIQTEWWHFNSCYRKTAYEKYNLIE